MSTPPEVEPPPPRDRDEELIRAGDELTMLIRDWRARHSLTNAEFRYVLCVLSVRYAQTEALLERQANMNREKST